jgi:hypothetical protein
MAETRTLAKDHPRGSQNIGTHDPSESGGVQAEMAADARALPPITPLCVTTAGGRKYRIGMLILDRGLLELAVLEHAVEGPHSERLITLSMASQLSRTHRVYGKLYPPVQSHAVVRSLCAAVVSLATARVSEHIDNFCRSLDGCLADAVARVPASLRACQSCGAIFHYSRALKTQCARCHEEGRQRPALPAFERPSAKTAMRVSRARKRLNDAARAELLRAVPSSPLLRHPNLAEGVLTSRRVLTEIVALALGSERLYTALERWSQLYPESQVDTALRRLLAQDHAKGPLRR